MAYVMNPYSYKLGYSWNWSDSWYANKKIYPVVLQNMLMVRRLITYFLTGQKFESLDIYLSHIHMQIKSGRLFILLFFYDTKFNYKKTSYLMERIQNKINIGAKPKKILFEKPYPDWTGIVKSTGKR